jgi:hypothetical protein
LYFYNQADQKGDNNTQQSTSGIHRLKGPHLTLKQAEKVKPNPRIITEAETHLTQAIDQATAGHADTATKHVPEAIRYLQRLTKEPEGIASTDA